MGGRGAVKYPTFAFYRGNMRNQTKNAAQLRMRTCINCFPTQCLRDPQTYPTEAEGSRSVLQNSWRRRLLPPTSEEPCISKDKNQHGSSEIVPASRAVTEHNHRAPAIPNGVVFKELLTGQSSRCINTFKHEVEICHQDGMSPNVA